MWPMPAITHKFVAIIFAEDVLSWQAAFTTEPDEVSG